MGKRKQIQMNKSIYIAVQFSGGKLTIGRRKKQQTCLNLLWFKSWL
jgi:hypothetical protein